ncbi:N-6 DNA methylase [Spongiactinospora sp. TRM90649]|uniref:N-6 DNA methylase n=1 Tax=Spongiactinospora sp. TRM90649 TaxID=3031114 RepID=UPI0023F88BDD|nr:N-6 DNA methylase [Spongiactinospora sp. TRM90649]MDF5753204.1 N-6 DNA methylase [Spongiactinospora sp. TRM90649]
MGSDATVNAGDIARLADVGRAAVSNWRRRYDDFPRPVGGTAASPLFSLREVEDWLRKNGKTFEVSLGDRVWQSLRGAGDDLSLPELVGRAGILLLFLHRDPAGWRRLARDPALTGLPAAVAAATRDVPAFGGAEPGPHVARLVAELAGEHGPADAFELIVERYVEAHSRALDVTRGDYAALMTRLVAGPDTRTVLDPACGIGTLLVTTLPRRNTDNSTKNGHQAAETRPGDHPRVLGQEINETAAAIAAVRLLLRGAHAEIIAGDALTRDGFGATNADAVVCHPPFNERAWGFDELTGDPRWEYGLPPRGESELAWVQHCLARVRPGGTVAILMPPAAASRRPGRRIRGNLLRVGALRGVVSLSPAGSPGGPDLWLLRRPAPGERPPSLLLMMDAGDDLAAVEAAWPAFANGTAGKEAEPGRTVRIIDLLDDEVDLSPARHRPRRGAEELGRGFAAAREAFGTVLAALSAGPPALRPSGEEREPLMTSVAELVKEGLITVYQAPFKVPMGQGDLLVLTGDDLAAGGPPTGRTWADAALVPLAAGDIVTSPTGVVRVTGPGDGAGAALGPQLTAYRVDPAGLDPDFVAGFLRFAGVSAAATSSRVHPASSRADARRVRIPRLPLEEQRAYGGAFRELVALGDRLRETAALGEALIRLGFEGLADGHLRPCDKGA